MPTATLTQSVRSLPQADPHRHTEARPHERIWEPFIGEVIVYETPEGEARVAVRLERETVWLTQRQMAELLGPKLATCLAERELKRSNLLLRSIGDECSSNLAHPTPPEMKSSSFVSRPSAQRTATMPNRHRLFISYSHEDKRWFKQVRAQLRVLERAELVDVFDDTQIQPGEDWYARLNEEMLRAKVGMLLVSASFLDSDFILTKEIPTLFLKHERAGMIIYPLLLRPCPWQEVGWLSRMQIRPPGAKAISLYRGPSREQALAEVAREIATILKSANPHVELNADHSGTLSHGAHVKPGLAHVSTPSGDRGSAHQSPEAMHGAETAQFKIMLDDHGQFVDEAGVRATLVEALEEFDAGREARIDVVAEPLGQLLEELNKWKGAPQIAPADREELVKKRRQIRSIEDIVRGIVWCLNVAVRDGSHWHFGEPHKLLAIADQIVAELIPRRSSRSERELIFHKLDIFRKDQSCGGSLRVTPEEEEALLAAMNCANWGDFANFHRGWTPIYDLPTILLPLAFASMVVAVYRFNGPNREQIEPSLRKGSEWGFGPG